MITKSPTLVPTFCGNVHFTSSGRKAFSSLLKLINFERNQELLIPAYVGFTDREGSGVLDPIEENSVTYNFYPVKKNFSIDLKILEDLISLNSTRAVLIIHYFGMLHCDILKIKRLCEIHNTLLIEDCCHTIYSKYDDSNLGDFGDFSFYSLHKVLPVQTGGFFKINNKSYCDIDIVIRDQCSADALEMFLKYDGIKAKKQVCSNYEYMCRGLKDIGGLEILHPELSGEIFPMNLPVFISKISREDFYFKMIDSGVTLISLYYRLIDSIDIGSFPISHQIASEIINFPINQDITFEEMDEIIKITKRILEA